MATLQDLINLNIGILREDCILFGIVEIKQLNSLPENVKHKIVDFRLIKYQNK